MHLFDPNRPRNSLGPMLLDPSGRIICNVPPLHIDPQEDGLFCVRAFLPTHGRSNSYSEFGLEVTSLDATYAEYISDPEAFVCRLGFLMQAPAPPAALSPEELFDD